MNLNIKKLHPNAKLPTYGTDGAACFDLYACTVDGYEHTGSLVYDGKPVLVGTGLAFDIPEGWCLTVYSRSGMGFNHGVRLANGTGLIDSDYKGELMIKLVSDSPDDYTPLRIDPGDRVAQARLERVTRCTFTEVDTLTDTSRGARGFGSTGR